MQTSKHALLKMLHPKADVERLYNPGKDGGRGLTDIETAFKTVTIELNPKAISKVEHERSKAKNSITKNATKFKREVQQCQSFRTENIIKSASQNVEALKYICKFKMKSTQEEKWKEGKRCGLSAGFYGTCCSSRTGNKHQKLPESNMWPASGEQIYAECVRNIRRQDRIVSGCEVLIAKTKCISKHNNAALKQL